MSILRIGMDITLVEVTALVLSFFLFKPYESLKNLFARGCKDIAVDGHVKAFIRYQKDGLDHRDRDFSDRYPGR